MTDDKIIFTPISDVDNYAEWPDGERWITYLVGGSLNGRICERAGVPVGTPIVVTEYQSDDGYSEWSMETEFQFTLKVGDKEIDLYQYDESNAVNALSMWLESND